MKKKLSIGKILAQYSYIFVFLIILAGYALTVQLGGNHFNSKHIASILGSQQTVIIGTIALGMAFVIITGQIDLSVGSSLVLTTGACIMVFNMTNSILLFILCIVCPLAIQGWSKLPVALPLMATGLLLPFLYFFIFGGMQLARNKAAK